MGSKKTGYEQVTIKQAWINLASDVLLFAIEDARSNPDLRKRAWAKEWLLTPAAKFLFDSLDIDLDFEKWILAGCPRLDNK